METSRPARIDTPPGRRASLRAVLLDLVRHPRRELVSAWNYKTAVASAVLRGSLFFAMTISAGLDAALGAFGAEFVWRFVIAGFYGALAQAFGRVDPPRVGLLAALAVLPASAHLLEFAVHASRGTPNLGWSLAASVALTVVSTAFAVFATRQGVLLVGVPGQRPFLDDLARMPALMRAFAAAAWRRRPHLGIAGRSAARVPGVVIASGVALVTALCGRVDVTSAPRADDGALERFLSSEDVPVESYHAVRHIEVANARFKARGWMDVETTLSPDGVFTWTPQAEGGSGYIRQRVIRKALAMEAAAIRAGEPARSAITLDNYVMSAAGEDHGLAVVRLVARRPDRLLVMGTMRVDAAGDLLDVRGRLAKSPSWWTAAVDVDRRYARIGGVRVAVSTDVTSTVRVAGVSTMRVRYDYLAINGRAVAPVDDTPRADVTPGTGARDRGTGNTPSHR